MMEANIDGVEDMHASNFMQRADGTLVMIDLLWARETFWQMHDRAERSERYHDDEPQPPDEHSSLMGGQTRPEKQPVAQRQSPPSRDDGELPF
jgi:hypothetical protein